MIMAQRTHGLTMPQPGEMYSKKTACPGNGQNNGFLGLLPEEDGLTGRDRDPVPPRSLGLVQCFVGLEENGIQIIGLAGAGQAAHAEAGGYGQTCIHVGYDGAGQSAGKAFRLFRRPVPHRSPAESRRTPLRRTGPGYLLTAAPVGTAEPFQPIRRRRFDDRIYR